MSYSKWRIWYMTMDVARVVCSKYGIASPMDFKCPKHVGGNGPAEVGRVMLGLA